MFKKIMGAALAATMMCGSAALCANAATVTTNDTSADDPVIYFDLKKSGWNYNKEDKIKVYCHIWRPDGKKTTAGTDWTGWGSGDERINNKNIDYDNGVATFHLSQTGNDFSTDDGMVYCVIFYETVGNVTVQTYNTLMSGSCIGDTMYSDTTAVENPEDSQKTCYIGHWENNPECGNEKKILSSGKLSDGVYPEGMDDDDLLANYLISYYNDTSKTDKTQSLIDELCLTVASVENAIQKRFTDSETSEENQTTVMSYLTPLLAGCTDSPDATEPTTEPTTEAQPTTEAEQPTTENVDPTVEPTLLGDVNGDDKITVADVTAIQKYLAEISNDLNLAVADVSGDNKITVIDATYIQKYIAEIITKFPADKN